MIDFDTNYRTQVQVIHAQMPCIFEMRPIAAEIYGITEHKGGKSIFKAVVAVAIAVAVPYAAGALVSAFSTSAFAASIAASGALGSAAIGALGTGLGGAIATGITGAALGALAAKITGQDVKTGAVSGGLGGALRGFQLGRSGAFSNGADVGPQLPSGGAAGDSTVPVGTGSGEVLTGPAATPADQAVAAGQDPTAAVTGNTVGGGGTAAGDTLSGGPQVIDKSATTAEINAGLNTQGAVTPQAATQAGTQAATQAGTQGASTGGGFVAGLKEAGIKVGSNLIGNALSGAITGDNGQEELLEQQQANLDRIRAQNDRVFNRKFELSDDVVNQARAFEPTAFGLQQANAGRIRDALTIRDQQRQLSLGGRSDAATDAARQRGLLQASRNYGANYDRGYNAGLRNRLDVTTAGASLLPSGAPVSSFNANRALFGDIGELEKQRREAADRFSTIIGDAYRTGSRTDEQRRLEEEAKRREAETKLV